MQEKKKRSQQKVNFAQLNDTKEGEEHAAYRQEKQKSRDLKT